MWREIHSNSSPPRLQINERNPDDLEEKITTLVTFWSLAPYPPVPTPTRSFLPPGMFLTEKRRHVLYPRSWKNVKILRRLLSQSTISPLRFWHGSFFLFFFFLGWKHTTSFHTSHYRGPIKTKLQKKEKITDENSYENQSWGLSADDDNDFKPVEKISHCQRLPHWYTALLRGAYGLDCL